MANPPRYKHLPTVQKPIWDPTDTRIIGFDVGVTVTAFGITHDKRGTYTLPEAEQMTPVQANDMEQFSPAIGRAVEALGLIEATEAEMDALVAAAGHEVPA